MQSLCGSIVLYFLGKGIAQGFDPLGTHSLQQQGFGRGGSAVPGNAPVQPDADGGTEQDDVAASFQMPAQVFRGGFGEGQVKPRFCPDGGQLLPADLVGQQPCCL